LSDSQFINMHPGPRISSEDTAIRAR